MGVSVQVDARLSALLRALGALGADGGFDPSWFSHPLDAIRHCLDDDNQRAAVFDLLDQALPPVTGPLVPAGASWHPLLADNSYGNVYVTVQDGAIGIAAEVATTFTDLPTTQLTLTMPLLQTGGGPVRPDVGPLEISVLVSLGGTDSLGIDTLGLRVQVGIDGTVHASVRIAETGGTVVEFDPTSMGAQTLQALEKLALSVLAFETSDVPAVASLVAHLPGLLGLSDAGFAAFPIADPSAVRAWFSGVVTTPAELSVWFGHLAALLSSVAADVGAAGGPVLTGTGTAGDPLRSPVLTIDGVSLELLMAAAGTTTAPTFTVGLGLSTAVGPGTLIAQAFLAEIPLSAASPAAVLPSAAALVTVPVSGGTVQGGVTWNGTSLTPLLRLHNVTINGTAETVDLTDARAVEAAASDLVLSSLTTALGGGGLGQALLALVGFVAPSTFVPTAAEPVWPHLIGAEALTGNLLTAIANVHRAVLDDATSSWRYLMAEIGSLFGITAVVTGTGTRGDPWLLPLAGDDPFTVALAVWDDRTDSLPAEEHLLRLGLAATVAETGWKLSWTTEVLAFDLTPTAATSIRLIGAQNLTVSITAVPHLDPADGLSASAASLDLRFHWAPDQPADIEVVLAGLTLLVDATSLGPYDLTLPGVPNPALPGLGLPLAPADLIAVLKTLLTRAWSIWGGDLKAYAIAGLLGLHDDLPGLPDDWPQVFPRTPADLTALVDDPAAVLTTYLRTLLSGVSADGSAYLDHVLEWLAALVADQLPTDHNSIPVTQLSGAGTHVDPWSLPTGAADADLLLWLDDRPPVGLAPSSPPPTTGQALLATQPASADELFDRDVGDYGNRIDQLDIWLSGGDGIVPYVSQTAVPNAWTVGAPLAVNHVAAASDPSAITQVGGQLVTWGHPAALLLVTAASTTWQPMIDGIAPGNNPDARIDLRGHPDADLSGFNVSAKAYTVWLDDPTPGSAALPGLVTQVQAAVARLTALTGGDVVLVGHGPGGVVARAAAAHHPAGLAGVITICAPHSGSPLTPLVDAGLADAVRLADSHGGDPGIGLLHAILDGGPASGGVLPPAATYALDTFAAPASGPADTVPGLAIGAQLPSGLVGRLAPFWVPAASRGTGPSFVGLGARTPLPTPSGADGEMTVALDVRADLARFRVADGPVPARTPHELTVTARLHRVGGWLVGDAGARSADAASTTRAELRARWVEVAVTVGIDGSGGLTVTPSVLLHDAGRAGESAPTLTLDDVLTQLQTAADSITLPAALDGAAGDFLRSVLTALDLTDSAGVLSVPALRALASTPAATLGASLGAVLDVLGPAAGATATTDPAGGWQLGVLGGTQTIAITPQPWTLRLTTTVPAPGDVSAAGLAAGLSVQANLTLPGFVAAGTAGLNVGALTVTTDGHGVSVAMPPWLPAISLAPPPSDPTAIGAALVRAVPGALVSSALGLFVTPLLGAGVRLPPLDQLILTPASTLLHALGNGNTLDATKVNTLLDSVRSALSLGNPPASGGLPLPGGLTLHAVDGPFALRLGGALALSGTTLNLDLGLALPPGAAPAPDGTVGVTLALPGTWGGLSVDFGVLPSGVSLSVQPTGQSAITILPHFDGLAALEQGAETVLPQLLQELVTQLSPPSAVLTDVLDLSGALGIYDAANGGFAGTAQSAALAAMLNPGWLASVTGSGATIATKLAALLEPGGPLPVPLGAVTATASTVTWTVPVSGGTATVTLGWDGTDPTVAIALTTVTVGPVVVDSVSLSVAAEIDVTVAAHLQLSGTLAPIAPTISVMLAGDRFSVAVLPLGAGTDADLKLSLAPELGLTASSDGSVQLALKWGLPLATEVMLLAVSGASATPPLLDRPFWAGGPTAKSVLSGAGLLTSATAPTLATPLPNPVDLVLGAIAAAAGGVSVNLTPDLALSVVNDAATGRTGFRLAGHADIEPTISLRFGVEPWLTDADSGVTAWVVQSVIGGTPAFRIAPGLDINGLGVVLSGTPLVDGSIVVGGAGGLLFLDCTFLDDTGQPALTVTGIGAAAVLTQSFVKLDSDDGDSFVAKVLPPSMQAPFDLIVAYRNGSLEVGGTGPAAADAVTLDIPLDLELVVIQITELLLGMKVGGNALSLEAAVSGNAALGPLYAAVARVGLIATFGAGGAGLRFRPPDQVSLSMDTPTLRLGGFLLVDSAHGRYIGGVDLTVLNTFDLTAIGIITTQLPDGSPGFSLLFIISVTLPAPIALGYGFFFAGAGGLLGIDRTIDLDALAAGLRTGAVESILFPHDIARNTDAIVRNLETVFPIEPGQFLIGPMAKITWGEPTLISIELGLVLDLGSPVKIAIIGLLEAALPDPDEPVLVIKVAFVGAIDLGASLLRFDASIYDSYIGIGDFKITLDGDIAVRLGWGAQPDFVASIGGFHPAYHPASYLHLPTMRRIALTLLRGNPSFVLTAYFAITANSVQFGTRLDFSFSVSGFSIVGDFGFDVLLQIAPFQLDAEVYASLAVKSGSDTIMSIDLDFHLTGPTPWIAHGTASFKILFFSIGVGFNVQFGPSQTNALVTVHVLPQVLAAFENIANWTAAFANPNGSAVSLRTITPVATTDVVIDAAGTLTISQRVLPLDTDVSMFGTEKPDDISRITVSSVVLGGTTVPADQLSAVDEMFSPAAYSTLSDADKLKAASFVPRPAGVRITEGTALSTDYVLARPGVYDVIVADDPDTAQPVTPQRHQPTQTLLSALAMAGATGRSAAAQAVREQAQRGAVAPLGRPSDPFAVTMVGDLRARQADGTVATVGASGFADGVLSDRYTAEQRARVGGSGFQVLPAAQVVMT